MRASEFRKIVKLHAKHHNKLPRIIGCMCLSIDQRMNFQKRIVQKAAMSENCEKSLGDIYRNLYQT